MRYIITSLLLANGFTALAANPEHFLPIFFIPNSGQTEPSIRYIAQTPQMSVRFAFDSAIFRIRGTELRVRFAGANPGVTVQGLDALAADPAQIRLKYPGADRPFVDAIGDLVIRSGAAELREQAPVAYQESAGVRHAVKVNYRILRGGAVAFGLADYDITRPLIID